MTTTTVQSTATARQAFRATLRERAEQGRTRAARPGSTARTH
ncbi:hypothetical protein ACIQUQ_24790 [Streptomyces sp. NPDC101118]